MPNFCYIEDGIQDPMHARQGLYQLSYSPGEVSVGWLSVCQMGLGNVVTVWA